MNPSSEPATEEKLEVEALEIAPSCCNNGTGFPGLGSYSFKRYPEQSLKAMHTYWTQQKMCDVEILLEDDVQPIRAHRVVLAAASPYFRAMFTSGFEDASKQCIQIRGISKLIMLKIMKFVYSGQIRMVAEDSVCELLVAANMLQVREITEACALFLERQLHPSNCIGIFRFSEQYDLKKLRHKAETYIFENFTKVCQGDEFLDLGFVEMLHMLKNENFSIKKDCRVFEACLRWIRRDCVNRKVWMRPILQVLRCYFSSIEYLEELVQSCPLIRDEPECVEYIKNIVQDLNRKKFFYRVSASGKSKFPCAMYVVGGYHETSLSHCEVFNACDGTWSQMQVLPVARTGLAVVFLDQRLFALGGRVHQRNSDRPIQDTNFVHTLDVDANSWTDAPPLLCPRYRLSAVALGGYVYVIGGSYHTASLGTVERFDPTSNTWCLMAPMNVARSGHACTTCNGKIYVMGGCNGTEKLDSVEVYDAKLNQWKALKPLPEPRSGLGISSLGDFIFAIGGCENTGQVSKVERYNVQTDEWQTVSSLLEARSGHSVVTMANKIYALGGFTGNEFLSSMEVYNHENNEWCSAPSLLTPRSGLAAAALM